MGAAQRTWGADQIGERDGGCEKPEREPAAHPVDPNRAADEQVPDKDVRPLLRHKVAVGEEALHPVELVIGRLED